MPQTLYIKHVNKHTWKYTAPFMTMFNRFELVARCTFSYLHLDLTSCPRRTNRIPRENSTWSDLRVIRMCELPEFRNAKEQACPEAEEEAGTIVYADEWPHSHWLLARTLVA